MKKIDIRLNLPKHYFVYVVKYPVYTVGTSPEELRTNIVEVLNH